MDLEFLIPISLFAGIFGIAYVFLKTRNMERMSLIEKGADASLFESKEKNKNFTLKIGMLMIGVALGIVIGTLLDTYTVLDEDAYFSMIFLFGGIALVLNDRIENNRKKDN